mmetsp:Transcript_35287/g.51847  ORF Transcript_35287/g.51847 Transcript_35287/m.51847 type:complete len:467 (-) Transcript_35287:271-1671(-)|eukprot:CAMPEP_0195519054 /NCGR_PEP_ID=MMETSP0794_2-20130614/14286_1 /TAXON_ID=515487 /ORGANISM="Stephanopyxis turris, Strain CCMP 815" /LENGTH=466 /DNA_ID=CAMNT_0040648145 /DNA_START=268 /DNA_END=1668 /DNA_ORIENTATION=-
MQRYRLIAKKGEGTFSEVLKAQNIRNQEYCAIKCMKNHFDSIEQVNNLREIQALQRLSPHPHVVTLFEVLYDRPSGRLALVFELMQMNFYELIRGRRHYLEEPTLKNYIFQLCKAMSHMHRHSIFHRDIKPENVLISGEQLKVADFGSCRGIYSRQPYTEYISTRWYRAPECLLTDGYYSHEMDMWGVGCVMFEVASLFPLFPGTNEMDQIQKIHKILGTPSQSMLEKFKISRAHADMNFPEYQGSGIVKLLPKLSSAGIDLVVRLLEYDPKERMSARAALRHRWFADIQGGGGGETLHMSMKKSAVTGPRKGKKKGSKWRAASDDDDDLNSDSSATHDASASDSSYVALPNIHGNRGGRTDEASNILAKVKKTVASKVTGKKKKIIKAGAAVSGHKGLPSIEKTLSIKGHGPISQKVNIGSRLLGQAAIRSKIKKHQNNKANGHDGYSYSKKRTTRLKKAKKKTL